MLNKVKHKIRLIQNKKAKTQIMHTQNQEREREEKVTESFRAFFLPRLGRTFLFNKSLIWRGG